jgi:hypothetical protein
MLCATLGAALVAATHAMRLRFCLSKTQKQGSNRFVPSPRHERERDNQSDHRSAAFAAHSTLKKIG